MLFVRVRTNSRISDWRVAVLRRALCLVMYFQHDNTFVLTAEIQLNITYLGLNNTISPFINYVRDRTLTLLCKKTLHCQLCNILSA